MLCSKCEAIRFPPAQLSSCLESGNTNDNSSTRKTSSLSVNSAINVKSKTKQTQPAAVLLLHWLHLVPKIMLLAKITVLK
jgi:hypothetical protein